MRTNITKVLLLGCLVAATALTLSAQGRGGRGPAPLSTTKYDVWTVAQLATPGNLGNYGSQTVQLAAPGVNIYSTLRNGAYGFISGCSMSAAEVSIGLRVAANVTVR